MVRKCSLLDSIAHCASAAVAKKRGVGKNNATWDSNAEDYAKVGLSSHCCIATARRIADRDTEGRRAGRDVESLVMSHLQPRRGATSAPIDLSLTGRQPIKDTCWGFLGCWAAPSSKDIRYFKGKVAYPRSRSSASSIDPHRLCVLTLSTLYTTGS